MKWDKFTMVSIALSVCMWGFVAYYMNTTPALIETIPLWIRIALPLSLFGTFVTLKILIMVRLSE